eukprot:12457989-Heterocapsa_arctica.AAC.1
MTIRSGRSFWLNTCGVLLPVMTQLPCGSMLEFWLASALVHMVGSIARIRWSSLACVNGRSSLPGLAVREDLELGRSGRESAKIYVD